MFKPSRVWLRRATSTALLAGALASLPGPAAGATVRQGAIQAGDAVLYRIFLRDGSMLVSYGEFARVGDRIVLSIPVGGTETSPVLHLLTIAEQDVDWERTDAYVEAARARRYAETRGETDFARLTREVADRLNQVGEVEDAARRLELAESARRQLVEWPRHHYGYRAAEIAQMASWLDQVVSELRIAAGGSSFDLAFVSTPPAPGPAVTLLPPPNLRERIEFGMVAARRSTDAAERISLLRAVLDALHPVLPEGSWMAAVHARASSELAAELKTDAAYAALSRKILTRATSYSAKVDVRRLESLVASVLAEDVRLQQARPVEVAALLATLDARIDAARRQRLARDAWVLRSAALRRYSREIRPAVERLGSFREQLTDVRQLAGPSAGVLRRVARAASLSEKELGAVNPPAEAASAHARLVVASALARRAASGRLDAVQYESMDAAWQASSAAAGALMLLDQSLEELQRLASPPAAASR